MAHAKDQEPQIDPNVVPRARQRPQSLFQQLSSFLPSLHLRKRRARQRPKSARELCDIHSTSWWTLRSSRQEDAEALLPRKLDIPTLSDEPCPNDPNIYYSFPHYQEKRCSSLLCGLGSQESAHSATFAAWPWTASANIRQCSLSHPYTTSHTSLPCAHLVEDRRSIRSPASTMRSSRLGSLAEESFTSTRGATPKNVYFEIGPEKTLFPHIPALNDILPLGDSPASRPSTRRGFMPESISPYQTALFGKRKTPSPKLHHVMGSSSRPYVHRQEVEQYLNTLRADGQCEGASRPTCPQIAIWSGASTRRELDIARRDSSGTVFYPSRNQSPISTSSSRPRNLQFPAATVASHGFPSPTNISTSPTPSPTPSTHVAQLLHLLPTVTAINTVQESASITVHTGGCPTSVDLELDASDLYRKQSRSRSRRGDAQDGSPTDPYDLQKSRQSNSMQANTSTQPETPSTIGGKKMELRGGGARDEASLGMRLKKSFLTCGACNYDNDPKSDVELPARRIIPPFLRGSSHPGSRTAAPHLRDCARYKQSRPILGLRGGGDRIAFTKRSQKLEEGYQLPLGLWYLVGGRGPPVTAKQWNIQKPGKRMSGLLGMAIYGRRAGLPYKKTHKEHGDCRARVVEAVDGEGDRVVSAFKGDHPASEADGSAPKESGAVDEIMEEAAGEEQTSRALEAPGGGAAKAKEGGPEEPPGYRHSGPAPSAVFRSDPESSVTDKAGLEALDSPQNEAPAPTATGTSVNTPADNVAGSNANNPPSDNAACENTTTSPSNAPGENDDTGQPSAENTSNDSQAQIVVGDNSQDGLAAGIQNDSTINAAENNTENSQSNNVGQNGTSESADAQAQQHDAGGNTAAQENGEVHQAGGRTGTADEYYASLANRNGEVPNSRQDAPRLRSGEYDFGLMD